MEVAAGAAATEAAEVTSVAEFFRPIDYQPPDISGGVQLLLAARKARGEEATRRMQAEVQRQYAENAKEELKVKRESAQREREKFDAEKAERQRRLDIENAGQLMPNSPLMRAARQAMKEGNPAAANLMGKPYGVSFDTGISQQPGNELQTPDFMQSSGGPSAAPSPAAAPPGPPAAAPEPSEPYAGPDINPANGDFQAPTQPPPFVPPGGAPAPTPVAAPAPEPAPQVATPLTAAHKLYAQVNGQRFEVPQQEQETTGLGPKYDAIYKTALEHTGGDETKAYMAVLAMKEKDDAQQAIADRVEKQIGARSDLKGQYALTGEQQLSEHEKQRQQSQTNAEILARSRVAAAAPQLKQEGANDRAMSLLERRAAGLRQTTQFNKLVASDKNVRGLMTNIADGTVPLQHADAQIQLARFFRQAQPTEGEMHILYNNLGGTMDKWNQFVARMENGDLSPEQLRQVKISAGQVQREHKEDLRRFQRSAAKALGPGSGFENVPDQAESLYQSLGAELGLDENELPPLYSTEGGISVGSGKKPTVRPRGSSDLGKAKAWLNSAEGKKADPALRARVEAKVKALEASGG